MSKIIVSKGEFFIRGDYDSEAGIGVEHANNGAICGLSIWANSNDGRANGHEELTLVEARHLRDWLNSLPLDEEP